MSTTNEQYDVVIAGAGPAGMCAALYTGRARLKTALLERGTPGGELLNTEHLDDVIGWPMILGRDLAKAFIDHALQFGAELHTDEIETVTKRDDGMFETKCASGRVFESPAVIVTAGGTPLKLGVPGELEYAGRGVSYCATCDANFFIGETICVVGGGDAAAEEADYLTRFANKVYLIHRRGELRAAKIIQERLFANPKIEVIWNTVVDEIVGTPAKGMHGAALRDLKTGAERLLDVTGCFVFVGFKPNTGIINGHYQHDASGYVITDSAMQSNIPGLFVAGDMRSQLTRQVTTATGDATTAAVAVDKYIKAFRSGDPHPERAILGTIGLPTVPAQV